MLAARHDSSSAPAANSRRKEWQLAWRCCCRCQPTATASPACAPPTLLVDPGAPSPDPLPHLGVCTISYSSPFPFLIRFDDSSAGCDPLSFSWSDASVRLSAQSLRNHHGQELVFTSSKVESRSKSLKFLLLYACIFIIL